MADQPGPLDAAMKAPLPALLDAEQVELFRDQVPDRDAATAVELARRQGSGRGRPPGALNKRSRHLRDYILALGYEHPAIGLAATYSRPVEVLAAELDCTMLEAAKLQQDARAELLPFMEQKLAALNLTSDTHDLVLVMAGSASVDGGELEKIRDQVNEGGLEAIEWEEAEVEPVPKGDSVSPE